MQRLRTLALSLALGPLLGACNGGKPAGAELLAPLQTRPLSLPSELEVELPLGSRHSSPALVVLTDDILACPSVPGVFKVCLPPGQSDPQLRQALSTLKAAYPLHLRRAPVELLVGPRRQNEGVRLALAEPSFFAKLALLEPQELLFSATFVSAFAAGGGKLLLVSAADQAKWRRIGVASRAAHLDFKRLEPSSQAAPELLKTLAASRAAASSNP